MKRSYRLLPLLMGLLLVLSACGAGGKPAETGAPLTWQEQYELGVRYLSEGRYEEAILAFTAAIDVDPRRAEAYVGRGDAYLSAAESLEEGAQAYRSCAETDYLSAVGLDGSAPAVYEKLAELYLLLGRTAEAAAILKMGWEATGDEGLKVLLESLEPAQELTVLSVQRIYYPDGRLMTNSGFFYDEAGYLIREESQYYDTDGTAKYSNISTWEYQAESESWSEYVNGELRRERDTRNPGTEPYPYSFENILTNPYPADKPETVTNTEPETPRYAGYSEDWATASYTYDEDGNAVSVYSYGAGGTLLGCCEMEYQVLTIRGSLR